MSFSENLKRIRKEKGFSQKEIAQKLGVSQPSYAQYENNKRNPKPDTIKKIALALGVEERELNDTPFLENIPDIARHIKETSQDEKILTITNHSVFEGKASDALELKRIEALNHLFRLLDIYNVSFNSEHNDFCFPDNSYYEISKEQLGLLADGSVEQIKVLIRIFDRQNKESDSE